MNISALHREHDPRLWTADQFLDFYMTRPDGERWQLVDGLAMMMTPPNRLHQRIAANLERLLNGALEASRPDLFAYGNVGVRIPGVSDFHPQPHVVICSGEADRTYYTETSLLAAEIISPSNPAEMIERKLEFYVSHPDNLYVLTVDQDSLDVVCFAREAGWARQDLRSLDDVLTLPAFGLEARLAEVYRGTPFAQ